MPPVCWAGLTRFLMDYVERHMADFLCFLIFEAHRAGGPE
jgi:hypothetical protein